MTVNDIYDIYTLLDTGSSQQIMYIYTQVGTEVE